MTLLKLTRLKPEVAASLIIFSTLLGAGHGLAADSGKISTARLLEHIRVLSSDAFEGRAPGTAGEQKTIDYLVRQFKAVGLQPGNPDGTYLQQVPMFAITSKPNASCTCADRTTTLNVTDDAVLWSRHFVPEVDVQNSDIVFVGYGVVAPEYGWDDFKGVDVRGKTLLMLVGDPPVPDSKNPAQLDPSLFKGKAMTYYGRWTYKFEIAALKGARAALIVHETGPAGYPFTVVVNSNTGERLELESSDLNRGQAAVEGWLTQQCASNLLSACGKDYEQLKKMAIGRDFVPVPLNARASFHVQNKLRRVLSHNVVGRLEGSDQKLKQEEVVYSAHWDHLGRDPQRPEQIYHGAYDNASGVAGLLEIARSFVPARARPKRSLLFIAFTAEEQGLLGARYYVEHPLYPIRDTVADLNMDGLNPWGRTRDVSVAGFGTTTLQDVLKEAAEGQKRTLIPDAEPEKGGYFRADHFEFARAGVPSLYFHSGLDYVGKPADFGKNKRREFTTQDYHKPSDVIKPDWDLSGALEDLTLLTDVGRKVGNSADRPQWKERSDVDASRTTQNKVLP